MEGLFTIQRRNTMNSIPHYKYLVVEDESLIRKNLIKKITALD